MAEYDTQLFELIDEVFRKTKWRYVRYDVRHPEMKKFKKPTLTIHNSTNEDVRIYRMDRDKKRFHVLVKPGARHQFATYPGYRWFAEIERRAQPQQFVTPVDDATWTLR